VKAAAALPPDVVEELKRYKAEILRLLHRESGAWPGEDWQAYFDERAGILDTTEATRVRKRRPWPWRPASPSGSTSIPVCSDPCWCFVCGRPDELGEALVPFGASSNGAAWLHHSAGGVARLPPKGSARGPAGDGPHRGGGRLMVQTSALHAKASHGPSWQPYDGRQALRRRNSPDVLA
jgi:hypothetical protein